MDNRVGNSSLPVKLLRFTQPESKAGRLAKALMYLTVIISGTFGLAQLNRLVRQLHTHQWAFAYVPAAMVSGSVILLVDGLSRALLARLGHSSTPSSPTPQGGQPPPPVGGPTGGHPPQPPGGAPHTGNERSVISDGQPSLPTNYPPLAPGTVPTVSSTPSTAPAVQPRRSPAPASQVPPPVRANYLAEMPLPPRPMASVGERGDVPMGQLTHPPQPRQPAPSPAVRPASYRALPENGGSQPVPQDIYDMTRAAASTPVRDSQHYVRLPSFQAALLRQQGPSRSIVTPRENCVDQLPDELLRYVLSYLVGPDLGSAKVVCKRWRNWAGDVLERKPRDPVERVFRSSDRPSLVQKAPTWTRDLGQFDPGFPACQTMGRYSSQGLRPLGEGCFPPAVELEGVTCILLPTLKADGVGYDYSVIRGETGEEIGRFQGHGGMPVAYDAHRHNGRWYLVACSTTPSIRFFALNETGSGQCLEGIQFDASKPAVKVVRLASVQGQLIGVMADEGGNLATWNPGSGQAEARVIRAHSHPISALTVIGDLVVSGATSGGIAVHRLAPDGSLQFLSQTTGSEHRGVGALCGFAKGHFVVGFEDGCLDLYRVNFQNGNSLQLLGRNDTNAHRAIRSIAVHQLGNREALLVTTTGDPRPEYSHYHAVGGGAAAPPEAHYSLHYHHLVATDQSNADGTVRTRVFIEPWGTDQLNTGEDQTNYHAYCIWARPIFNGGHPVGMAMLSAAGMGTGQWQLRGVPL